VPSSRKFLILGKILEQAGHQGLPKIEPFGIPAWKNLKRSSRSRVYTTWGKSNIRRGSALKHPGRDPQNICNQVVENHALLGTWNRRLSIKIVGNSKVRALSLRILRENWLGWNAVVRPDPGSWNAVSADREPVGKRCSNILISINIHLLRAAPAATGRKDGKRGRCAPAAATHGPGWPPWHTWRSTARRKATEKGSKFD